ncbi:MAG: CvpA family protein [Proteobacteria bacterium]|nr:CvpA family protein [Pseudomonadota bacterium]
MAEARECDEGAGELPLDLDTVPVNVADLAVVGVLLLSALLAFFRGAVREFLSIASWGGAAAATYFGFQYAQPYASELITLPLLADAAAGAALFITTLIVISLIGGYVSRKIRESRLGALDRSLGFLFGLVRGALVVVIAYVIMTWALLPEEHPAWVRQARALPLVEQGAELLVLVIPPEARADWANAVAAAKSASDDGLDNATKFDLLMNAPPVQATPGMQGYRNAERKDMDRLIESTQ